MLALVLGLLPLGFTYRGRGGARAPARSRLGARAGRAARQDVARRAAPRDRSRSRRLQRALRRRATATITIRASIPRPIDVPGNGIDEDCSGSDAPIPPQDVAPINPKPLAAANLLPTGLNVILITVDTLRADLGFPGNPKPLSPNLDALAARSVVFERAYSLASYTGKSVGPLLIGKYPSETHRGWGHFNRFAAEDTMVAERLQKAGIHTVGVQAHWYFSAAFGLARGFDVWDTRAQPPPGSDQDNDATITGGELTDAAIAVLSELREHRRRASSPGSTTSIRTPNTPSIPRLPISAPACARAYDGEVWYTDHQIGRLLEFVAGQPWADKTAIVVTSDHGEAFGEHQMIRHGFEVWEELVRVPLLFYVPGVAPHHVTARRSAIDLVPTLLDLFGRKAARTEPESRSISSRALARRRHRHAGRATSQPSATSRSTCPRAPTTTSAARSSTKDASSTSPTRFATSSSISSSDPGEKNDLSGDKELLADMKAALPGVQAAACAKWSSGPVPKERS